MTSENESTSMVELPTNGEETLVDAVASNGHESSDDVKPDGQPLFEQPIILEGKRSRKPTLRLELSDLTPTKKELSIPQVDQSSSNATAFYAIRV